MWLDKLHEWRSSTTTCERIGAERLLGVKLGQDAPVSSNDVLHLAHVFVLPLLLQKYSEWKHLGTSSRQSFCLIGPYCLTLQTVTKAQHMAHNCQNLDLLPPSHDSCQTACSSINNSTTTLLRQSSAMDGNISPLHLPCCIKVPRKLADTWSSPTSANSSTILLA